MTYITYIYIYIYVIYNIYIILHTHRDKHLEASMQASKTYVLANVQLLLSSVGFQPAAPKV